MDWTRSHKDFYRREREFIRSLQPKLEFNYEIINQQRSWIVAGEYHLWAEYKGEILEDDYSLRIVYPPNYPEKTPDVYELEGKVRGVDEHDHLLVNESLCLEVTPQKYIIFKRKGANTEAFFEFLLDPYLYRFSYLRKHSNEPYPARGLGLLGQDQWLKEYFKTNDTFAVLNILRYIIEYGYHRQNECPCGSGMKIRNCHKDQIREIKECVPMNSLAYFITLYLKGLEKRAANVVKAE